MRRELDPGWIILALGIAGLIWGGFVPLNLKLSRRINWLILTSGICMQLGNGSA
jgi:hypothetical protein